MQYNTADHLDFERTQTKHAFAAFAYYSVCLDQKIVQTFTALCTSLKFLGLFAQLFICQSS